MNNLDAQAKATWLDAISERTKVYTEAKTEKFLPKDNSERARFIKDWLIADCYKKEFADLAAHAPDDIPFLLEELKAATEEIRRLEETTIPVTQLENVAVLDMLLDKKETRRSRNMGCVYEELGYVFVAEFWRKPVGPVEWGYYINETTIIDINGEKVPWVYNLISHPEMGTLRLYVPKQVDQRRTNIFVETIRNKVKYPNADGEYGAWDCLNREQRKFMVECADYMCTMEGVIKELAGQLSQAGIQPGFCKPITLEKPSEEEVKAAYERLEKRAAADQATLEKTLKRTSEKDGSVLDGLSGQKLMNFLKGDE